MSDVVYAKASKQEWDDQEQGHYDINIPESLEGIKKLGPWENPAKLEADILWTCRIPVTTLAFQFKTDLWFF